jgi:PPE-repeat protein
LSKSSSPSAAIYNLVHDPVLGEIPHWAGEIALTFGPQLSELAALSLGLIAPAVASAPLAAAPVGAAGGFAGLAGLAGLAQPGSPAAAAPPVIPAPNVAPAAGPASPGVVTAGSTPASVPPPTTTGLAASAQLTPPPQPPSSPPVTGAEGVGYFYLVGGIRAGSKSEMKASASTKRKAPQPDTGAVEAVGAAPRKQPGRRRLRRPGLTDRGYRYEYIDPDSDLGSEPGESPDDQAAASTVASEQGGRQLGFAGTVRNDTAAEAAGLTTLTGDGFNSGPRIPMVPGSWDTGPEPPDDQGRSER